MKYDARIGNTNLDKTLFLTKAKFNLFNEHLCDLAHNGESPLPRLLSGRISITPRRDFENFTADNMPLKARHSKA